jgi:hypothetical protein
MKPLLICYEANRSNGPVICAGHAIVRNFLLTQAGLAEAHAMLLKDAINKLKSEGKPYDNVSLIFRSVTKLDG